MNFLKVDFFSQSKIWKKLLDITPSFLNSKQNFEQCGVGEDDASSPVEA